MTNTVRMLRPNLSSDTVRPVTKALTAASYEDAPLRIGDVIIDHRRRQVYRDGEAVYLTKKEYALLTVLIDHPNVALTRERLLFLVWGYTVAGDTRTVDVHVKQLRKKLGWQERICTVFRVGYRFIV